MRYVVRCSVISFSSFVWILLATADVSLPAMAAPASGASVHLTLSHSAGVHQVVDAVFLRSEHSSPGRPLALLAVPPAALPSHLQSDQREVESAQGGKVVKVCLAYVTLENVEAGEQEGGISFSEPPCWMHCLDLTYQKEALEGSSESTVAPKKASSEIST